MRIDLLEKEKNQLLKSQRKRKILSNFSSDDDESSVSRQRMMTKNAYLTPSSSSEDKSANEDDKNDEELKKLLRKLTRGIIKNPKKFLRRFEKVMGKTAFLKLKNLLVEEVEQNQNQTVFFTINENVRLLRGSWHQADLDVFHTSFAGRQCCAMAVASILQANILSPSKWNTNVINQNMMEANALYKTVHIISEFEEVDIPQTGFLFLSNFDVVKNDLKMFDTSFKIAYDCDPPIFGNLCDEIHSESVGHTLLGGLTELFLLHSAGILIANDRSYAVIANSEKFYFCDSHSCDEIGSPNEENGRACVIECDTIEHLSKICKRATGSHNEVYTLDYVDVTVVSSNAIEFE